MKDALVLTLSGLLAAGAAAVTTIAMRSDTPIDAATTAASPDASALTAQLESLEAKQAELEQFLDSLTNTPVAEVDPAAQDRAIAAAVRTWLEENADDLVAADAVLDGASELESDLALEALREAEISDLIDMISEGNLSGEELQYAWTRLAEAGRLDDVVAELERMVELDPQDPDLRVTLGNSYLQQLFHGGGGPLAGVLAAKADGAFDAAIQLDDSHLDARFMKAVSLSNWPAFLGKQGEAIAAFEELIVRQEEQQAGEAYAQSYLFLGNMYLETGEADKALATWRRGLEQYPTSSALREQIERNGGN
ncbi:MAG: tetratricopeptide (TPR) repeat protein [Planctomycetota bacterium]|jgi:tetratricopeptide (TPR) repeat protein